MFTTSIARTTPAQKPRGLSRRTRFSAGVEPVPGPTERVSKVVAVTIIKYTVPPAQNTVPEAIARTIENTAHPARPSPRHNRQSRQKSSGQPPKPHHNPPLSRPHHQ